MAAPDTVTMVRPTRAQLTINTAGAIMSKASFGISDGGFLTKRRHGREAT